MLYNNKTILTLNENVQKQDFLQRIESFKTYNEGNKHLMNFFDIISRCKVSLFVTFSLHVISKKIN